MFTPECQARHAEDEQKPARRFGNVAVGILRRLVVDVVDAQRDLDRLRGRIGRVGLRSRLIANAWPGISAYPARRFHVRLG